MQFLSIHEEASPLVAAACMVDKYTSNPSLKERNMALAYMRIFSDDMQDWYDYNASLTEPLLDLGDSQRNGCRCLPRHTRECPNMSVIGVTENNLSQESSSNNESSF